MTIFHLFAIASVIAAQRGGHQVVKARSTDHLPTKSKGKTKEGVADILTLGDQMSNQAMVNTMLYTFPGLRVVSEENLPVDTGDNENDSSNPVHFSKSLMESEEFAVLPDDIRLLADELVVWIDPLDATKEYAEGLTSFVTTMVCVARKGEPLIGVIHQPFANETYWATKFGVDRKLLRLARKRNDSILPTTHRDSSSGSSSSNGSAYRVVISRSHKGDIESHVQQSSLKLQLIEAAGSGFKTLELLKGEADIYLHKTYIKKWDICAPNALINFASSGHMGPLHAAHGPINYDFESHAVHKNGIFATVNTQLVKQHEAIVSALGL